MATSPDLPFNLKHRLIGALILVVAPVIILPWLLTGDENRQIDASPRSELSFAPESEFVANIGQPGTPDSVPQDKVTPSDASSTENAQSLNSATEVASRDSGSTEQQGWVVRVGVFGEPVNATKRRKVLRTNGMDPRSEDIQLNGRNAVRLFLGPFPSEDEAERERGKAVLVTGERAFIVKVP